MPLYVTFLANERSFLLDERDDDFPPVMDAPCVEAWFNAWIILRPCRMKYKPHKSCSMLVKPLKMNLHAPR